MIRSMMTQAVALAVAASPPSGPGRNAWITRAPAIPRLQALCGESAPGIIGTLLHRQKALLTSSSTSRERRVDASPGATRSLRGCDAVRAHTPLVLGTGEQTGACRDAGLRRVPARPAIPSRRFGRGNRCRHTRGSISVRAAMRPCCWPDVGEIARSAYDRRCAASISIVFRLCTEFTIAFADLATGAPLHGSRAVGGRGPASAPRAGGIALLSRR